MLLALVECDMLPGHTASFRKSVGAGWIEGVHSGEMLSVIAVVGDRIDRNLESLNESNGWCQAWRRCLRFSSGLGAYVMLFTCFSKDVSGREHFRLDSRIALDLDKSSLLF